MINFKVDDMNCGHCISTITKALAAADKDAKVEFDLAARQVRIAPAAADAEKLRAAIEQAGYTPLRIDT